MSAWEEKLKNLISPTESKWPYRVVQIKPNRRNDEEIYTLSGREEDIAGNGSLFLALYDLLQRNQSGSTSVPGKNSKPPLKGWPLITLNFLQPNSQRKLKPSGKLTALTTGQKWIRCVGYTDNRQIVEAGFGRLIDNSDIRRWSNKIVDLFAKPLYIWEKGKKSLSYSGQLARLQGIEGYALVTSATQGKELFTKMLKIFDYSPDPTGFKYSGNEAEELAYPTNPPDFQLLGKQWEAEIERPRDSVIFDSATLTLPLVGKIIPLVRGDRVVYDA